MPRCNKVKNPCKICLSQVTPKNGLQCQGACQTWMHFDCLNYTPGKIRDIKAGIITVTCPCPDCKSMRPKEFRTDEAFSCNNSYCPANQAPKCDNETCPINFNIQPMPEDAQGCALDKCGRKCKTNSIPHLPDRPMAPPLPPCKPAQSFSDNSVCRSNDIPGDYGRSCASPDISMDTLDQMCNTVGQLANQLNCLMSKMNRGGGGGGGARDRRRKSPNCGKLDCSPRGTKSHCPKPCFCPFNPGR